MQKYKIVLIAVIAALVGFFTAKLMITKEAKPLKKSVTTKVTLRTAAPAAVQQPPSGPAKMAIVLDDWGNNYGLLKEAVALGRPVTVAVLPHQVHSHKIAEEACKNGLGVILHMPMQPKNQKVGLEPHLLTTETSDADIIKFTDAALANVGACTEGVNNHMGSAATTDKRVMRTLLSHLKEKNLFFFDSFVITTSVGPQTAKEVGIPFAKRDVFIDNTVELEAIKSELRHAAKLALAHGEVIVIGHDKAPTLEAIRQILPEIETQGIRVVPLRTLVKR